MARVRTPNFHDARLSVAQSCLREHVARSAPGAPESGLFASHPIMQAAGAVLEGIHRGQIRDVPTALTAYDARRAAQTAQGMLVAAPEGIIAICLDLRARYILAWALDDQAAMNELESEFNKSGCDWAGWVGAFADWIAYYWDEKAPRYNPPTDAGPQPFALPSPGSGGPLRVGILGDWGTGEPEASAVLAQLMAQRPDVVIHVGDVYYAGTRDEQQANFLALIQGARTASGLNIPVYTLPGNHDYYSGGAGFYEIIPRVNEGVAGGSIQQNSFWCLRSDAWQLQGMDTGYYDSDLLEVGRDATHLRDDEAAWHQARLADAGTRQVILFSHHQLFSAFEKIGGAWQNPSLLGNLQAWQAAGRFRLAAWFWGHEHVLEVYQVPGSLAVLGRCVGNSAFPVFTDSSEDTPQPGGAPVQPATSSPDGSIAFPNGFVQTQPDDLVWASGFAMLELADDGTGTARYYQVIFNGDVCAATTQLLWQEPVPAGG
jgi:hypothetical protein